GIHLLVPRISEVNRVLAFFASDGRLFFAIPMANRTCIGTTDTRVDDPRTPISDKDREFVLDNINARLNLETPLSRRDIIAERCGVRPLVVETEDSGGEDFLQMSRKHVVETLEEHRAINIFGGKLTDCVNVGLEVCEEVERLGVALQEPESHWYGEPSSDERDRYLARARALGIDEDCAVDTGEPLSQRLWRRYGARAEQVLEIIDADPSTRASTIAGSGLRRCEVIYMKDNEMVVTLEDLLRRRSKIALLRSREELEKSPGVDWICECLFGDDAQQRHGEYFAESD
ncbi:MAG: glycerol-3-phosphate dehydrogenase C-terminal domain-containing protein, partial [Pseudomonadota bacterium]